MMGSFTFPDLGTAVERCIMRGRQGIGCTMAFIDVPARDGARIRLAASHYQACIDRLGALGLRAGVTIKPSLLGAHFDDRLCEETALGLAEAAGEADVRFEIATEGRGTVDLAIRIARSCSEVINEPLIDLQVGLERTAGDLSALIDAGIVPRLVKGAYANELGDRSLVQARFREMAQAIIGSGRTLVIGTHDPELLEWSRGAASGRDKLECGFLMGVAEGTMAEMAGGGWQVTEYVPYGTNVQQYVARRMAEQEARRRP